MIFPLLRLVVEKKTSLCIQLIPRYCCSFELFASCYLAKHFGPASQTTPASQEKHATPVNCAGVTLVVYIPEEQCRVTAVCVQYKLLLARQVWVRLGCKQQAKFKLHFKKSPGSQHLEECTGADTQQQTILVNTWSIWHFAGLGSVASSCGTVTGPHATKERSSLQCFFIALPWPSIHGHSPAQLHCHSWWLYNNTFTLISLGWISSCTLI